MDKEKRNEERKMFLYDLEEHTRIHVLELVEDGKSIDEIDDDDIDEIIDLEEEDSWTWEWAHDSEYPEYCRSTRLNRNKIFSRIKRILSKLRGMIHWNAGIYDEANDIMSDVSDELNVPFDDINNISNGFSGWPESDWATREKWNNILDDFEIWLLDNCDNLKRK